MGKAFAVFMAVATAAGFIWLGVLIEIEKWRSTNGKNHENGA